MRRVASLALLIAAALSRAELYGVQLVTWTAHPSTQGTGIVAYAGGVTGTGLNALQNDSVSKTPPKPPLPPTTASQSGSASVSADVSFHAYWIGPPPTSLYLNLWKSGDALATVSWSSPAGTATASSSAPVVTASQPPSGSTVLSSYNGTSHYSGWQKTSSLLGLSWQFVGYVNTRPLYRTVDPVQIHLDGVSTSGSATTFDGMATSLSGAVGGYNYFLWDSPW